MKSMTATQEAREVIAGLTGDFTAADIRNAKPQLQSATIGYALQILRRNGAVEIVSGTPGNYTYRHRRYERGARSPVETAWAEFRAAMGDCTIPDYCTTSFGERNA